MSSLVWTTREGQCARLTQVLVAEDCSLDDDKKRQDRALQARYPYRGLCVSIIPVTEEDADAVASSGFAPSLLTRRRYSDAGSSDYQESPGQGQGKKGGGGVTEEELG